VRLYSGKANDWTARLPAIAVAAARVQDKSFTIDGEGGRARAGLSRFEELRRSPRMALAYSRTLAGPAPRALSRRGPQP
jgi:ATP-dependent DNA ligase